MKYSRLFLRLNQRIFNSLEERVFIGSCAGYRIKRRALRFYHLSNELPVDTFSAILRLNYFNVYYLMVLNRYRHFIGEAVAIELPFILTIFDLRQIHVVQFNIQRAIFAKESHRGNDAKKCQKS